MRTQCIQSRRRVANFAVLLLIVAANTVGCGLFSREAKEGSAYLKASFFEIQEEGDSFSYATIVLQNVTDSDCRVVSVEFRNADTDERVISTVLKRSSGNTIASKSIEFFTVELDQRDSAPKVVKVEFEHGGRKWYSPGQSSPDETRSARVFPNKNLSGLTMYVNSESALNVDALSSTVNGREMAISGAVSVAVDDDQFVSAVELKLDDTFTAGDRLLVKLSGGERANWYARTKLFHQFSVGTTQYDQVVRPVSVSHSKDAVTLRLYNEADYRKSPALLKKVMLNGDDVTRDTTLPPEALPPDFHHYDEDVRDVIVRNASSDSGGRHKYKIYFERTPPLRSKETPETGYFDVQSFSFETCLNVPFPIGSDNGWGFPGAACVFQGGLRPRPERSDLIQRFAGVNNGNPSIPTYACASAGTRLEHLRQMAFCGDFLVTGQPVIPQEERKTLNRSDRYFRSFEQLESLSNAWIASVISDNRLGWTSPEDLEWQAWASVALGSHGLWLTPPHKGDRKMMIACSQAAQKIRDKIRNLEPLVGISRPISFVGSCDQEGLQIKSLLCGCDNLLVFVFNEWSSRSAYQGNEAFNAAMRQDVELKLTVPEQWKYVSVADPLTGLPIAFEANKDTRVTAKLPDFDNVQLLHFARSEEQIDLKPQERKDKKRPFVWESSPVIDLGKIPTNSKHVAEFKFRSVSDTILRFEATEANPENSKAGEFVLGENNNIELMPGETKVVAVAYKAPGIIGEAVTNIQFQCDDESFNAYIVADTQELLELSPSIVDFGLVAVRAKSAPKTIAVKSIEENFRLRTTEASSARVVDVEPAEDGGSLSFCVLPKEVGTFSGEVQIEVLFRDALEPLRRTLKFRGEARESVFASPSTVSQLIRDKPLEYSILVKHVAGEMIMIDSVEGSSNIKADWPQREMLQEHTVRLTIAPDIVSKTRTNLSIKGKSRSGNAFTLDIPVDMIAINQRPKGKE